MFIPKSAPSFPNPASWLSSTFNKPHFSPFITNNLIITSPSATPSPLFFFLKFKGFVQQKPGVIPVISNYTVDSLHPVPELSYLFHSDILNELFSIPFKDTNCFTRVLSPHLSEILKLYGLSFLIPLYPCIISATKIRTLVLHFLSPRVSHRIAKTFLFDTVPPAIPLSTHIQYIRIVFTLQPLPTTHNWEESYQQNSEKKRFLDHMSINTPLNQSIIRKLPAA